MDLSAVSAARFASAIEERAPARVGILRRHALALIVALGLAIRLALLITPRSYYADEIYQYLEPAHRLVFGNGIVTWDYRYGIRSWLMPLALSVPMRLGAWIAPDGSAYLLAAKGALVLFSLLAILAAGAIGARTSRLHGCFAAFVAAIWSECALFATQALTESIAVTTFLAGAALLYAARDTRSRLVLAGALLAFAAVIRFQYAPAIGLFALLACGRQRTRWLWLPAGALAALGATGALDMMMGQVPFGWIAENVRQNITVGRSYMPTDGGPLYYPLAIAASWSIWLAPLWLLAREGARRYPALFACALANILVHTLIAHKEYRFILLSTTLLVLLAAIGTVDLADRLAMRRGRARGRVLAFAACGWAIASVAVTMLAFPSKSWAAADPGLKAFAYLRDAPGLCGVALTGTEWSVTGGYAYLHRAVPIYEIRSGTDRADTYRPIAAGFDTVAGPRRLAGALPPAYRLDRCFAGDPRLADADICLYRRAGPCDPAAARADEINRVMIREGW